MFFKRKKEISIPEFLKKLEKLPPRNPTTVEEGKARFLAQVKMMKNSPVTNMPAPRLNTWKQPLIQEKKMSTLITVILVIGLVFGGSTATVYAAQESIPDEFLYPVKILSEDFRLNLALSPDMKSKLAIEYAFQRIDEIIEMKEEGLVPSDQVFSRLENQINMAIQFAASLGNGNGEKALLQIRDMLQERERLLDQISDDPALLRIRTLLQDRIQEVESGIADPEGLYNEFQYGWDNTPNTDNAMGTMDNGQVQNGMNVTPGGTENQFGSPSYDNTPAPTNGSGAGGNPTQENAPGTAESTTSGGNPTQEISQAPVQGTSQGGSSTQQITPGPTQETGMGGNSTPGGNGPR